MIHLDSLLIQKEYFNHDVGERKDSAVIAAFPTKLEKLKWVGADAYLSSVRSGLSPLGASNADALLELFPSLESGVVVRPSVRSTDPLDADHFP